MAIEWNNNLSTGVDWQDRHHKELFKRVSALLDAMSVGMGKDELDRIFNFLDSYFTVHFDAEEQAMSKHAFPGAVEHLGEHTGFIDQVSALRREFATGATAVLVVKVQRLVVDWLINHIGGSDKKLGTYILKAQTNSHVRD
jgi:hemerythrin